MIKKELSHAEKMYELGLVANSIVKLRLESPLYSDKIAMDILINIYKAMELDVDNQRKE